MTMRRRNFLGMMLTAPLLKVLAPARAAMPSLAVEEPPALTLAMVREMRQSLRFQPPLPMTYVMSPDVYSMWEEATAGTRRGARR